VARVGEALELARALDHPFSIAYALYHNGFLAINRYRFEECLARAQELAEVADENDYTLWRTLATVLEGVALSGLGKVDDGLIRTEAAIDLYKGLTTPPVFWPFILTLRGFVHAVAGRPERALELLGEAATAMGSEEAFPPEFWVFKGDFSRMLVEPELEAAEDFYLKAIELSKALGLHLIELQASTRLVTLHREVGRAPDGSEELAALYATFTEGLDEHDLVVAGDLLG
jgi:tetratricopeptide (TPR) repeat protein